MLLTVKPDSGSGSVSRSRSRIDRKDTRVTHFHSTSAEHPFEPEDKTDSVCLYNPRGPTRNPRLEDFLRGSAVGCDWFSPSVHIQPTKHKQEKTNTWSVATCVTPPTSPSSLTERVGGVCFCVGWWEESEFPKNHLCMSLTCAAFKY